jgi:hypothetical protein
MAFFFSREALVCLFATGEAGGTAATNMYSTHGKENERETANGG